MKSSIKPFNLSDTIEVELAQVDIDIIRKPIQKGYLRCIL